jgi:hypothetical protein
MIVANIKPIIDSAAGCSFGNIKVKGYIIIRPIAKLSAKRMIIDRQNNETQKEKASDQDTVLFMLFSISYIIWKP